MKCPYCLSKEPEAEKWQSDGPDRVVQFLKMWPDGEREGAFASRFIDRKLGITIVIHDCVDIRDWAFKMIGPWPKTQSEIKQVDAFIRFAWSDKRIGRPPMITVEDILESLRRLPDTAQWVDVADEVTRTLQAKYGDEDFDASVDTLKKILQRNRLTLRAAKAQAKKEDK